MVFLINFVKAKTSLFFADDINFVKAKTSLFFADDKS